MSRRILIGRFPDGGAGVRMSQPGYDVMSNPFNNEMASFNSDWAEAMPMYMLGEMTAPYSNSVSTVLTVMFPASLGYVPFALFAIKGMGDPVGTGWAPVFETTGYLDYQNAQGAEPLYSYRLPLTANKFIQCYVFADRIQVKHYMHLGTNNNSEGWPQNIKVLYAVTRLRAIP